MARGRHARRSGLRAWLLPDEPPPPSWRTVHAQSLVLLSDDLRVLQEQLQQEVVRLRAGAERSTAAQVLAELRAERLEAELAATREELAALRADVEVLREELVWAFAERRTPLEAAPVTRLDGRQTGTA